MKGLGALPKSILQNIVSHLSPGLADLRNCSAVCRALGEASTTALYNHIDLSIDERYDPDADAESIRRQLRLVRSISEYISSSDIDLFRLMIISRNPKLGALVRIFKNFHNPFGGEFQDATLDPDSSMLIGAAQNMKNLCRASLTPNQLAAYIIATVQSYPQLVELTVYGLRPEEHIWSMTPTSLTTLNWEVPAGWNRSEQNPWDTARFLVNVVEATCPGLEWLDISVCQMETSPPELPVVPPDRVQQYRGAQATSAPTLAHLRHFGFRYQYDQGHRSEIQVAFLDFIGRHRQSLKSVSIPVGYNRTREELDFILQVCRQLPDLKDLTLAATRTGQTGENMTGYEFLHAFATNIASPHFSIERFSVTNTKVPFSPAIGKLFRPWTSLKFLRLGDGDNNNGPYADDGRLNFEAYKPVSTHHFKY
jgi:hypothetical protein